MVSRKGFFSYIGLAILGALGSSALAASPPLRRAKTLNLDGSAPVPGANGLIPGAAPRVPLPDVPLTALSKEEAIFASADSQHSAMPWRDFVVMPQYKIHGLPALMYTGDKEQLLGHRSAYFQMSTFAGNLAVTQLVTEFTGRGEAGSIPVLAFNGTKFRDRLIAIACEHPEVFDTVVRDNVYFAMSPAFHPDIQTAIKQRYYQASKEFGERYCNPVAEFQNVECEVTNTRTGEVTHGTVNFPIHAGFRAGTSSLGCKVVGGR